MAKQWHVRKYWSVTDGQMVISFGEPFGDLDQEFFNKETARAEKVLNRELPNGKQRKRRAKAVTA
jgi:hypothetical protein